MTKKQRAYREGYHDAVCVAKRKLRTCALPVGEVMEQVDDEVDDAWWASLTKTPEVAKREVKG